MGATPSKLPRGQTGSPRSTIHGGGAQAAASTRCGDHLIGQGPTPARQPGAPPLLAHLSVLPAPGDDGARDHDGGIVVVLVMMMRRDAG
ncbi:hypothetical protein E2C01_072162 [Portunus trituberculatus]|uniref:Uncharacterized protein n=1 Tax=Portunus trituberculatus TaxID=210409 RepID=A0A5B7HZ69_PORTR|nr:hypothetical protein [Portunus trituberculatus]